MKEDQKEKSVRIIQLTENNGKETENGKENKMNQNVEYEKIFEEAVDAWDKLSYCSKLKTFCLFSKEFSKQFMPLAFVFSFYIIVNVSNVLFVSRQNKEALLNGVGLGLSLYNMIAVSVSLGVSSALDTFCPHAFGAMQFRLMGCYLNRARIILAGIYLLISFLLFFMTEILIAIKQKEEVAIYAGKFCQGLLPGMIFFCWADAQRRFLQAQNIVIEPVLCVITTSLIHPLWIYLLTHVIDLGAFGNGFSISITNFLNFILVIFVTKFRAHPDTLVDVFIKESITDFKEFFKISLPTLFMICLETWNYEIITLMSGYLKDGVQRDAHIILVNFGSMIYMFPFALGVTSSNIVGKYVGGFFPKKTEVASNFILLYSTLVSLVIFICLNVSRPYLPQIFSNQEKLQNLVDILLVYYFFYQFFDFITTSFCGIFRGLGMQLIIAWANLICFYFISLPLNYILTFPMGLEIYGIRLTYIIVIALLFIVYSGIYKFKVDFYEICQITKNRLQHDQKNIDNNSVCMKDTDNTIVTENSTCDASNI